jgi:hypothetical protein
MERCAFCGATELSMGDEEPDLERPDGFVPFLHNEAQALDRIRALQKTSLQGLRRWWLAWASQEVGWRYFPARVTTTLQNLKLWWEARRSGVVSMAGFYVPFWVFDGLVEVCWSFGDGTVLPEVAEHLRFENLVSPAVEAPDSTVLQRLYPFDLDRREAYDPHLLEEWTVRIQDRPAEVAADGARDLMLGLTKLQVNAAEQAMPSPGAAVGGRAPALWVQDTTYELVLLPVWTAWMERRGKHLLALINGQTGKLTFSQMPDCGSGDGGARADDASGEQEA